MYTVYVLKSLTSKKSYVGLSDNIERRLQEHNSGKSLFTRKYRPWEIIYRKEFPNVQEARIYEKYLKSTSGRSKVLKQLFKE